MRVTALALGAVCAAVLAGSPAAAQQLIRAGQTVSGRLDGSDARLGDGSYYEVWSYRGRAGERLAVTLRSGDFDAYLAFGRLSGGECDDECETDDDGAGGTDARITATLPADGVYGIRVNTLGEGETGDYTLTVEAAAAPAVREISLGQTVTSRLDEDDARDDDDGSFFELWTYRGPPGQRIVVTLRSADFDAYLGWGRLAGGEWEEIDSDDDGAGGTDARLQVTLGDEGEYAIRANSLSEGETGSYTLTVEPASASGSRSRPAAPDLSLARPVRAGEMVAGALEPGDPQTEEGAFYDVWTYEGRAGETLTLALRSDEVDAVVSIGRVADGRFVEIGASDDGSDGTDSLLAVTLPAAGTYVIRASSYAAGETGAYTLEARSR